MRTLFYGTPALAVPFLELLARKTETVGVLSQPDQPAGRGLKVAPTPVKARALELGLRMLRDGSAEELRGLRPDLAVAVAYGRILSPEVLAVPALGSLNVHFSLLPKYRGAAPVQWSLARGESRTGVTVFWIEPALDSGPVFVQRALDVGLDEDAEGLFARLTSLGLDALVEALDEAAAGRLRREPQSGEPSLAPRIRREDARLDFSRPAAGLHDLVRGLRLWPTAFFELKPPCPRRVQVLRSRLGPSGAGACGIGSSAGAGRTDFLTAGGPGSIVRVERGGGILVQCGHCSTLWLLTVRPEGKKPVAAADFINGLRLGEGHFLPLA